MLKAEPRRAMTVGQGPHRLIAPCHRPAVADRALQATRHNRRELIPVLRRCLPFFCRAIVLERDRVGALPEIVERGVVRVCQSDPNAPIVWTICGHVVEDLVVGEDSGLLLLLVDWDQVVHHVLIENRALARVHLNSVQLQSNSRGWLHRTFPRKRHQMRYLVDFADLLAKQVLSQLSYTPQTTI